MPKATDYQHFCVVARSLELIGEKWSLLIVRDLLRGPQRFSDLQRYMGNITPKWLTQRLRDLEAAGIVERDSEPGRREVWYRLTAKGHDLAPVIRSLVVWGIDHASRPPLPGEAVFPEQAMSALAVYMNEKGTRARLPVAWRFHFEDRVLLLMSRGGRWRLTDDDPAIGSTLDVTVETRAWLEFLAGGERGFSSLPVTLEGARDQQAEFKRIFGRGRLRETPRASAAATA